MKPLEKEFNYYLSHQNELVEKYNGKTIVIIGEDVIGAYDSDEEAYRATEKEHELGTFLMQKCSPGDKDYTVIYNRVAFN
ncbi:MAG: hypothetical protein LUC88_07960 [Prevotella sp.]|nr:hypothetical protein [Prevotella sp.]